MSEAPRAAPTSGVAAAFAGYLLWGLVPLFWKQLASVEAHELIAHRLVWSFVLIAPILAWRGGWHEAVSALKTRQGFFLNLLSSGLLTANWLVYVWAVNAGHVIECSLGYFLVPLLNVALGKFVLHEKLRRWQWVAIALAASGVVLQLVQLGRLPWIALTLAATFGTYGLLRKQSPLGPLTGLAVETALLAPVALAFLLVRAWQGGGALGHASAATQVLIASTGLVTTVPLLLFAYGARQLRLTTLGLLQYTAPTVQFALGILVYNEIFSRDRALSFALIWSGLAVYTLDTLWNKRREGSRSSALQSETI